MRKDLGIPLIFCFVILGIVMGCVAGAVLSCSSKARTQEEETSQSVPNAIGNPAPAIDSLTLIGSATSVVDGGEFRVPAEVPLKVEKVLYEYDPPGSFMGDGTRVLIARISKDSLDSFIKDHASVESEWSSGPFHIGEIGIDGPTLVKWFHDWHRAAEIQNQVAAVADWEKLLSQKGVERFHRYWYKHHQIDSFGKESWQIDNARLWIIDVKSCLLILPRETRDSPIDVGSVTEPHGS